MGEVLAKIWYMIAVLPLFIFNEGSDKFRDFLKRKNIYQHWDRLHSLVVVLLVLAAFIWFEGLR